MANAIDIQVDTEEVQQALAGTSRSIDQIEKKTLNIIAKGTLKAVKNAYKATLKPKSEITYERTGALLKAFKKSVKDGVANVYPRAVSNGSNWAMGIACILNYGAKNGIKPRGFIQVGEKYAESGGYMDDVNAMVNKELDKYWG